MQGRMWRAFNEDGTLTYTFVEALKATHPYYVVRAFGGFVFLFGMLVMAYNVARTLVSENETEDVVANATRKRKSKGVDWIVANDVSSANGKGAMGGDDNTVHLVTEGKTEDWEPMTKQAVAHKLVEKMAEALNGKAEAERDD